MDIKGEKGFFGNPDWELAHFDDIGFRFRHMSSARSTSDGRGPVARKEFRIGRSQGNLARTPDVAVVISLNNFLGPVDDTVTAQKCSTKH